MVKIGHYYCEQAEKEEKEEDFTCRMTEEQTQS